MSLPDGTREVTEGEASGPELERCTIQVLSNPLLLKVILKGLSFEDLLNCSLVDRKLNVMAREVLRENGNCLAAVEDGYEGSDISVFSSVLAGMTESPFSGLSIHLIKENQHRQGFLLCSQPDAALDKIDLAREVILDRIDIQYIKIGHFRQHYGNGALKHRTLEAILTAVGPTLQALSVEVATFAEMRGFSFTEYFGLSTLTGEWLPGLNTLEVVLNEHQDLGIFFDSRGVLKELLLAARNLQNLQLLNSSSPFFNDETVELILRLPHKPFHLVKEFAFRSEPYSLHTAYGFALLRPQLRKLHFSIDSIEYSRDPPFEEWLPEDQAKLREALTGILLSSKDSLEHLAVEHHDEFILMMSQWDVPVLSQVKHLELNYYEGIDEDVGVPTSLERIDFSSHFPRLSSVSIKHRATQDRYSQSYLSEHFRSLTQVYSCPSVTTLRVDFRGHTPNSEAGNGLLQKLEMCQRIFPNVKHLIVTLNMDWWSTKLWTLWPELVSLTILKLLIKDSNFDSVFLGIDEKEVQRLGSEIESRDQGLLQIVPTSPSIGNLKNLSRLRIQLIHAYDRGCYRKRTQVSPDDLPECNVGHSNQGNVLFSTLLGFCAFSRMPGLKVEVNRNVCNAEKRCYLDLTHLQPFVKLVDSFDTGDES